MNDANVNTYIGIADCHGIESFMMKPKIINDKVINNELALLKFRANANPQRFAVVYEVNLKSDEVKSINKFLDAQDWIGALKLLKTFQGIKATDNDMLKNIPDPMIDPWR